MKRTSTLILSFLALITLAGCSGGGFKKTKSGLLYKVVSNGSGPLAQKGDILKVHFIQRLNSGNRDSILSSSYEGLPTYAQVDSVGAIYSPAEVFGMLKKGDSAVIVMLADSLQKKQGQLPPFIKKEDKLTLSIKVVDIFKDEEQVRNDQTAQLESKKAQEVQTIQKYLADKNINAEKTEKGVFVQVLSKGDGPKVDSGKAVHVMYRGETFGGKVFDSNLDSTFGHTEPFVFVIGQRGAIEGWDDGLRLLNKGGKAKLYIPSMMAYGPNPPQGAPFKAYENLIFDVEVVDVTTAQPRPQMPPMMRRQMPPQQQGAESHEGHGHD